MKPLYIVLAVIVLLLGCKKTNDETTNNLSANAIVGWGDSLTYGAGGKGVTYLSALTNMSGITTYNKGIGGERSYEIKTRMVNDALLHKNPTIIWAGRNNFKDSVTVKKDIAAMVASLGHQHYIVLGIINGNYSREVKGAGNYNRIIELNKQLATIYGDHFIDIRSYLITRYNEADSTDLANHKNDVPAASIRGDSLHLNAKGYVLVAKKILGSIDLLKTE